MPNPSPNSSLTLRAYERLRGEILAGSLRPDQRLKISEICQSSATNLSAIREALSRLTSEGLVIAEPQRGFRVAPVSVEGLRDLTRLRIEIEGLGLRYAIAAGDMAWEQRVVAATHELAGTPGVFEGDVPQSNPAYPALHEAYHRTLCSGGDSPLLLQIREQLYVQGDRYRMLFVPLDGIARDAGDEHGEIAEAVLARDADRAVALMTRHLTRTFEFLKNWLPPEANAAASDRRLW